MGTPRALMKNIASLIKDDTIVNNLNLVGRNGYLSCPGVLISAISSIARNCDHVTAIIMPDFDLSDLKTFTEHLVSDEGPLYEEEQQCFQQILALLNTKTEPSPIITFSEVIDDDEPLDLPDEVGPIFEGPSEQPSGSDPNTFICPICGVEKKGRRSLQQHYLWHKRHPQEDYLTCHICKECGKVCADYNAMKFHVRQVHCDRTLRCTYSGCSKTFKV